MEVFNFNHLNPNKLSIVFTWDDNSPMHEQIAHAFTKVNKRCTFYVNPGEDNYKVLASMYRALSSQGFEIGSHGHTHEHFTALAVDKVLDQFVTSKKEIDKTIGISPTTFAFPHHDFNDDILVTAHEVYLETRNTLHNSVRISLKSHSTAEEIFARARDYIEANRDVVFSGHSVTISQASLSIYQEDGYEPITIENLKLFLGIALSFQTKADICTFEQAALKAYIRENCLYSQTSVALSLQNLKILEGISLHRDNVAGLL